MSSPDPSSSSRWALVLEHRERLQRLVRARLPEPRDAEDVVQDALIRVVCFAGLDEARVGALLTTTALRLCVDTHRGKARQQRMLRRIAVATPAPGPEEIVCDRQLGEWLMGHIQQLPGRERQVLLARASGLSTTEAASRFQISAKAAEGAFTRGRARLRRLHEQDVTAGHPTGIPSRVHTGRRT
ncbi:MAG TPA: sigma-70 family RNA polymerase sigma factor [Micromonosporaceae bacterium]|nr:sigma-70 family RNA polymerase sigma factor [Micromonosporaceae bacterium]